MAQRAVVALGNIAKGFPLRMATVTRPRLGEILRSGLESALRCLSVWPRDALTRQGLTLVPSSAQLKLSQRWVCP